MKWAFPSFFTSYSVNSSPTLWCCHLITKHLPSHPTQAPRPHFMISLEGNQSVLISHAQTWWVHIKTESLPVFGRKIEVPTDTPTEFDLKDTVADIRRRRVESEQTEREEAERLQREREERGGRKGEATDKGDRRKLRGHRGKRHYRRRDRERKR